MITRQDFFDEKLKLPSPPAIALRILQTLQEEENSFEELSKIIKADPVLTSRTLKLANSALYGLSGNIDSLERAISMIGTQALKNIALSFIIIEDFKDCPQGGFKLDLFWRRSITAAVAAEILSKETNINSPDIFITSLLQDIGILVMFLSDIVAYTGLLDQKRISGKRTSTAEAELFGFDHSEVGYHLFSSWNLPPSICEPILHHHDDSVDTQYKDSVKILSLADKIASIYHGTRSNLKSIEVRESMQKQYCFTSARTTEMIDAIGERSLEVLELYAISPGDMKPFSLIMLDANNELGKLNYSYEQIVLELTQAKKNAERLALELKDANDKLRELTVRDGLTGLYNHIYFQKFFESEVANTIRYNIPTGLLLLDIDYFKNINDQFGHPAGDYVLVELSKLLAELVRRCDVIARYGGEEFAIVLPETGATTAKVLANRLRRGIEQHHFIYNNTTISVTVSIGISSSDLKSINIDKTNLISASDKALYKAKRGGRNRVEIFQGSDEMALTGTHS